MAFWLSAYIKKMQAQASLMAKMLKKMQARGSLMALWLPAIIKRCRPKGISGLFGCQAS